MSAEPTPRPITDEEMNTIGMALSGLPTKSVLISSWEFRAILARYDEDRKTIRDLTRERDEARTRYQGLWDDVHAKLEADVLTAETKFFLITGEEAP